MLISTPEVKIQGADPFIESFLRRFILLTLLISSR